MILLVLIFWITFALVAYTYVVYPMILYFALAKHRTPVTSATPPSFPSVSVVISAFNEQNTIAQRIENIRLSEYPQNKIEMIIGSDGSTDNTTSVLEKFESDRVRVLQFSERRGKASVLNDLVASATGEIIVFSDANTVFEKKTIEWLVRGFSNALVGTVCGNLILVSDARTVGAVGELTYWSYESFIKRLESNYRTAIGATGGVYAVRRSLYRPLPTVKPVTDDLVIPLKVLEMGYNTKYEVNALAYEQSENSVRGEFRRKARISAQNFSSIKEFSKLLHPKMGFIAFALWSHKIVRWIVPFLMLAMGFSSLCLSFSSEIYRIALYGEGILAAVALAGLILDIVKIHTGFFGIPYYFFATNAALFVGFLRFALKVERPMWAVNRKPIGTTNI